MTWKIEIDKKAKKDLANLDHQIAKRILVFLRDRLSKSKNPRLLGEPLQGKFLGEFTKFRVGEYRIISKIEDEFILITVIKVGHRKEVYK